MKRALLLATLTSTLVACTDQAAEERDCYFFECPAARATLDVDALAFGPILLGSTSDRAVVLTSAGTAPLLVARVAVEDDDPPGAFGLLASEEPPLDLAPGEALTVTIRFTPAAAVPYTGRLIIETDDPDAPHALPLSGEGAVVDEDGDSWVAEDDCDDEDPDVHPEAEEVCNGVDDDCDGLLDDDDDPVTGQSTYYLDDDGDGWGDETGQQGPGQGCEGGSGDGQCDDRVIEVCADTPPPGYASVREDCDDDDASVHPGAPEVCGGGDEDCDDLVDDEDEDLTGAPAWHLDGDADGYGDPVVAVYACLQPQGAVPDGTDCDDGDPLVNPGATEVCNGIDDDCDGLLDDEDDPVEGLLYYYADRDGDGIGRGAGLSQGDPGCGEGGGGGDPQCSSRTITTCDLVAPEGYSATDGDCDDNDDAVFPGAEEVCNGIDDDCDDAVDEGCR